jgi:hypothetical protein
LNFISFLTSKLPHSLFTDENTPEVCLMVKDLDKKDRDYEKTIRKYKEIIEENKLENIVKQVRLSFLFIFCILTYIYVILKDFASQTN